MLDSLSWQSSNVYRPRLYILPPPTPTKSYLNSTIRKLFGMANAPTLTIVRPTLPDLIAPPVPSALPAHTEHLSPTEFLSRLQALRPDAIDTVLNQVSVTTPAHYKQMNRLSKHEYVTFAAAKGGVVIGFFEVHRGKTYKIKDIPKEKQSSASSPPVAPHIPSDASAVQVTSSRFRLPRFKIPSPTRPKFVFRLSSAQRTASASSERIVSASSSKFKAQDVVKFKTTSPSTSVRLGVEIPSKDTPLRVAHVCAAMITLNKHAPYYRIFKYQCFWFSAAMRYITTGEGVEALKKTMMVTAPASDTEEAVAVGPNNISGDWNFCEVLSPERVEAIVSDLRKDYLTTVAEIERLLKQKVDEERQRRADIAARIASEAAAAASAAQAQEARDVADRERAAREAAEEQARAAAEQAMTAMDLADRERAAREAAEAQAMAAAEQAAKREGALLAQAAEAAKREAELIAKLAAFEAQMGAQRE